MPTRQVRVIYALSSRPAEAPEGWEVWNAPRPLHASQRPDGTWAEWQGEFRHGIFYTAVDPQDAPRVRCNAEQDGYIVRYVTRAEARAEGRADLERYIARQKPDDQATLRAVFEEWDAEEQDFNLLARWQHNHYADTAEVNTDR